LKFARVAHSGQTRKYTNEPYIIHPIQVSEWVREYQGSDDMICAALLHDVVEDTPVTLETIQTIFGEKIAELVEMLTDVSTPEDGDRAERKAKDLQHSAKCSADAATIKIADLICNSQSICVHDPKFAKIYMKEKRAILNVLRHGDPRLWAIADQIVTTYFLNHPEEN